jgi:hypothetical protein
VSAGKLVELEDEVVVIEQQLTVTSMHNSLSLFNSTVAVFGRPN